VEKISIDKEINYCSVVWALFIALFANGIVTVEWSHPYCNDQHSGLACAAFGFPLPFKQWSGVS
jgi:hypothetical protein